MNVDRIRCEFINNFLVFMGCVIYGVIFLIITITSIFGINTSSSRAFYVRKFLDLLESV